MHIVRTVPRIVVFPPTRHWLPWILCFAAFGVAYLSCLLHGAALAAEGQTAGSTTPSSQELAATLADFNRGCALLDQYQYVEAAGAFEKVVKKYPDWTAARFNLGLAQLNMEGQATEGTSEAKELLATAKASLEEVLRTDPNHVPARFVLGIYYQHIGDSQAALKCFEAVHQRDRDDPFVMYKYADILLQLDKHDQGIRVLERIVDRDPGFISALYRLALQYSRSGQRDRAVPLLTRFKKLNDSELAGGSFVAGVAYGDAGKYYRALGADNLPLPSGEAKQLRRIVFSPEPRRLGVAHQPWKWPGGEVNLPSIAAGDLDSDGDLDLCLAGYGDNGQVLFLSNSGQGQFSAGVPLGDHCATLSLGDFDNDGDLDLWLDRVGEDWLLLNDGKGAVSRAPLQTMPSDSLANLSQVIDLDSDGDLDLFSAQLMAGSIPARGDSQPAASHLWSNNRNGSWTDQAQPWGLDFPQTPLAALVSGDFDNDRDLDLIAFPDGNRPPLGWINDRGGAFRNLDGQSMGCEVQGVVSATTGDPDKDGDQDLLVCSTAGLRLLTNSGNFRFQEDEDFARRHASLRGTGGQFADMDNDGDLDLVLADAHRKDGAVGPALLVNRWPDRGFVNVCEADAGNLLNGISVNGQASCVVADFTGDGRCDLLLAARGEHALLLENLTRGGHWIEFDLRGTATADKKTRSNNSAVGARVEIKTGSILQQYVVGGSTGPTATAPLRVHAGLGEQAKVDWLRIIWPDAVLQAELELPADRVTTVTELQRKTSSCPYLFAWNGNRFEFVSDFGGVGGLGYWIAPHRYAAPDPTEYLPLPRLEARNGVYELRCVTPLEEVTYFDEAKLIAVDHPLGTQIYPREMMAVSEPAPPFEVFCIRESIAPACATDNRGRDVTELIRHIDRRYAGATAQDQRFHGVAQPHFLDLDFADRLESLRPEDRPLLILHGWVEYGYSSTNYAAHQAGVQLQAPTVSALRGGQWTPLCVEVGYPAGVNHIMTVDLTGKLLPSDRLLRVATNMDLYWDQIFLARHDRGSQLTLHELATRKADLHCLGYPREYSPDGAQPNLSDYDNVDRAVAWKLMAGDYTRYGDVRELLQDTDDCYAILGHGDEVTLEFTAADLPPIPAGCRRSFLFKTDSYCKDMDLYTAYPDTVHPLPFHAMSGYPYGPEESYPQTPKTRDYQRRYNTRRVGEGQ